MNIRELSHPKSIWTWTGTGKNRRASLWLPYLDEIAKEKGKKWRFSYNGGEVIFDLGQVESILLYGATGNLPVAFLDALANHKITLMVHRRNMPQPMVFYPWPTSDDKDLLSRQILARENEKTAAYISRVLVKARLQRLTGVILSESTYKKLSSTRTVSEVRVIEAHQTRRYWEKYFASLDLEGVTRRSEHPVNQALDALSFFFAGILLRWALFHKFSPAHGYLHIQTNYIALIYDLMEPHHWMIEQAVSDAYQKSGKSSLVESAMNALDELLEETVYVPATCQQVRRKNLLHGTVLALRSYLLKETRLFVLPMEGEKKGGRPPKIGYQVPGARRQT